MRYPYIFFIIFHLHKYISVLTQTAIPLGGHIHYTKFSTRLSWVPSLGFKSFAALATTTHTLIDVDVVTFFFFVGYFILVTLFTLTKFTILHVHQQTSWVVRAYVWLGIILLHRALALVLLTPCATACNRCYLCRRKFICITAPNPHNRRWAASLTSLTQLCLPVVSARCRFYGKYVFWVAKWRAKLEKLLVFNKQWEMGISGAFKNLLGCA